MNKSQDPDDPGFSFFTSPLREQRILTCAQGTMIYHLAEKDDPMVLLKHHLHPTETVAAIERKIREMLWVNPDIEFTPELQSALGIAIVSFQKAPKPPAPPDEKDVIF